AVLRELSRVARANGAAQSGPTDAATVIDDVYAMVGSGVGITGDATAIISPALPVEIIDAAGDGHPANDEIALRRDTGSWRIPMPSGSIQIRMQLDAALAVEGHPGIIQCTGF